MICFIIIVYNNKSIPSLYNKAYNKVYNARYYYPISIYLIHNVLRHKKRIKHIKRIYPKLLNDIHKD